MIVMPFKPLEEIDNITLSYFAYESMRGFWENMRELERRINMGNLGTEPQRESRNSMIFNAANTLSRSVDLLNDLLDDVRGIADREKRGEVPDEVLPAMADLLATLPERLASFEARIRELTSELRERML